MITKQTSDNTASYQALFERAEEDYNKAFPDNPLTVETLNDFFFIYPDLVNIDKSYQIMPLIGNDLGREPSFIINANTRAIAIPDAFRKNGLGVKGDHLAEMVFFTIDRFFDNMDLYDPITPSNAHGMRVVIQWENAEGQTGVHEAAIVDASLLAAENQLLIGWAVDKAVTSASGNVKFSVRFIRTDANNRVIFNLSTLTSTITINNGLDFEYDGSEFVGINNIIDNRQDLLNRLKSSVIVDVEGEGETPEIFIQLVPDVTSKIDLSKEKFDDVHASDEAIYLVDLDEATGEKELSISAGITTGAMTYTWHKGALGAALVGEEVAADKVQEIYKLTEDATAQAKKRYYSKDAEGVYLPLALEVGSAISDEVYEKFSSIIATETGNYCVEIDSKLGKKPGKIFSRIVRIPGPSAFTVAGEDKCQHVMLGDNNAATLSVEVTAVTGDKMNYVWSVDGVAVEGNEATLNVPVVAAEDKKSFDKLYKVSMTAERNKDVSAEPVEREFRVTAPASAPVVTPVFKKANDHSYWCSGAAGTYAKLKATIDISGIVSDKVEYQWYKVNADDSLELYANVDGEKGPFVLNKEDFDTEGHAEALFEVCDAYKYVCKATNFVEASTATNVPDIDNDYLIVTH